MDRDKRQNRRNTTKDKKIVDQNDILYTEYTYREKGGLFNETLNKKGDGKLIPLKKGLDPTKYGGYNSATTSYFTMIEFDGKKKDERVVNIVGVPIYVSNQLAHNKNAVIEYFENMEGLKNVKIIEGFECIKKNALLVIDSHPLRIRGQKEKEIKLKNSLQFKTNSYCEEVIRKIEKIFEKNEGKVESVDEKYDNVTHEELNTLYDELIAKMRSAYANRPSNQIKVFEEGREKFVEKLTLLEKTKTLKNAINLFSTKATTSAALKSRGGAVKWVKLQ